MFTGAVKKLYLPILFIAIFGVSSSLQAQSVKHKVQDEETLFSIAREYQVTVQQLKSWNNLSGNAISIGQVLIIKQQNEEQEQKSGTYTVKPDDTLFSIAQKFGVSTDDLKQWNNLEGAAIQVGQTLRVQPHNTLQPEKVGKTVEQVPSVTESPASSSGTYTVKSGDTLFRIAQLFGMEVEKLKALNELASNNISVGQQLRVEAGSSVSPRTTAKPGAVINYKLKQGMDLGEFLRVFEMTKEQFEKLNPQMKATYINKGQVVKIVVPKTENDAVPAGGSTELTALGSAMATKYNAGQQGTVTTNGELYNPKALTAAHSTMAIGSVVFVKNPENGRGVIIRINDRITEKGLKLSKGAWQALKLSENSKNVIIYRINE